MSRVAAVWNKKKNRKWFSTWQKLKTCVKRDFPLKKIKINKLKMWFNSFWPLADTKTGDKHNVNILVHCVWKWLLTSDSYGTILFHSVMCTPTWWFFCILVLHEEFFCSFAAKCLIYIVSKNVCLQCGAGWGSLHWTFHEKIQQNPGR